jgi:hypothetical protein
MGNEASYISLKRDEITNSIDRIVKTKKDKYCP